MTRMIEVQDLVSFPKSALKKDALQFFADTQKDGPEKTYLLVKANATYSGYKLNGRCYPGIHMEQGVPTWCSKDHGGSSPFNAPVLLHHDTSKDAIGRVVKATYHHLKQGREWYNDWQNPATGQEEGSGYTRLAMAIADFDASQKFLDGRFLTFSTSFRSPYVMCSICQTNLLKDDCEHEPGKTYETEDGIERECYLVTGPQHNKEVSVVNEPAQPRAVADEIKVVKTLKEAMSDAAQEEFLLPGLLREVKDSPLVAVMDSAGKVTMLTLREGERDVLPRRKEAVQLPSIQIPDLDAVVPTAVMEDGDEGTEGLSDEEFAIGHIASGLLKNGLLKNDDELRVNDVAVLGGRASVYFSGLTEDTDGHQHSFWAELNVASKKITGHTGSTFSTDGKEPKEHGHTFEFDIDDLNEDTFGGQTRDASYGPIHVHDLQVVVNRDEDSEADFESCIELARQVDAQDTKLSTEQRKKLKSGFFCGPGRSFPVPDCAHVSAARRLIGRYKGSADSKKRILDSVNQRATKLSCDKSDAGDRTERETTTMTIKNTPSPAGQPGTTPEQTKDDPKTVKVLTDQLEGAQVREKELQSKHDTVTAALKDTTEKLTDVNKQLHEERCLRLSMIRAITGRPVAGANLDSMEGIKAHAEALRERLPESIKDSLSDESAELLQKLPKLRSLAPFANDKAQPKGGTAAIVRDQETLQAGQKPTTDTPPPKKDAAQLV